MIKRASWLMGILALGAGVAALLACLEWATAAAPPLSIEDLLHEEIPKAEKRAETPQVDNGACYVCHGNYDGEPLVCAHAKEKVGCIDCHGPSYDHRNDEDNVTPPDVMYGPDQIAPGCAKCHETHDAPAHKVIALWQERGLSKTDPDKLVCTDCHGEHRLKFRTVWWNKKTREVFVRKTHQEAEAEGRPAPGVPVQDEMR
jgi:hypothetical protein